VSARELARRFVPRSVRNALRRPGATLAWIRAEAAFRLGRSAECRLREDWAVRCHPACVHAFALHRDSADGREELQAFVRRCTDGMALLDIGANFGIFTLAALRFGGPSARVVAVDPSATANRLLAANLDLASARDRVTIVEAAVGDRDGDLAMLTTGPAGDHYLVAGGAGRPDAVSIPQLTIPSLVARTGVEPTHVKIDVEGFETEVLRGGAAFLSERRPIIFLELHGALLRARGQTAEAVLDLLASMGYERLEHRGRAAERDALCKSEIARIVCSHGRQEDRAWA
jgi:FkbM family methyltransferase